MYIPSGKNLTRVKLAYYLSPQSASQKVTTCAIYLWLGCCASAKGAVMDPTRVNIFYVENGIPDYIMKKIDLLVQDCYVFRAMT